MQQEKGKKTERENRLAKVFKEKYSVLILCNDNIIDAFHKGLNERKITNSEKDSLIASFMTGVFLTQESVNFVDNNDIENFAKLILKDEK